MKVTNSDMLSGTWVDKESLAMQFIDFYSNSQARFGYYNVNYTSYDTFNYSLNNSQLIINYLSEPTESIHELKFLNDNSISISNLTSIPENPIKYYQRKNIITENNTDTIIIHTYDIFYEFEHGISIEIDSVWDSRCPIGVYCFWAGNGSVRFKIVEEGNFEYTCILNTSVEMQQDTLIGTKRYRLVDLFPYPIGDNEIDYNDYYVKLLIIEE